MELALWRDLSVVWLSIFCFVGLALPLVVLYFAVRGMNALHNSTARLMHRAQQLSSQVPSQTARAATRISEPVILAQNRVKRVETFFQSLVERG